MSRIQIEFAGFFVQQNLKKEASRSLCARFRQIVSLKMGIIKSSFVAELGKQINYNNKTCDELREFWFNCTCLSCDKGSVA